MLINVGQIVLFNKRFVIVMNSRYINNDHHHSSVFPFYGCAANVIVNTSVNAAYPSIPANLRRSYMGMQVSGNLFHGRVAGFNVPPDLRASRNAPAELSSIVESCLRTKWRCGYCATFDNASNANQTLEFRASGSRYHSG